MAFAIRNLSVLAYAQGFTLWHYRTGTVRLAEAALPGFFDTAADMMAAGDMVLCSGAEGGRILVIAHGKGTVVTTPLG